MDYLILDASGLVVNAAVCDPAEYPVDPAWVPLASVPAGGAGAPGLIEI